MAYRKRMLDLAMDEYRHQILRHAILAPHLPKSRRRGPEPPELLKRHGYA